MGNIPSNLVAELRQIQETNSCCSNGRDLCDVAKDSADRIERLQKAVDWWKAQAIKSSGNEELAKHLGVMPSDETFDARMDALLKIIRENGVQVDKWLAEYRAETKTEPHPSDAGKPMTGSSYTVPGPYAPEPLDETDGCTCPKEKLERGWSADCPVHR